jgi:DNA-binding MarR family transcriptional regulator
MTVAGATWRDHLQTHATRLRAGLLSGEMSPDALPRFDAEACAEIRQGLGPMTMEALQIVEAYVIGAVARERPGRTDNGAIVDAPPEFFVRLNLILNGLEPVQAPASGQQPGPSVIQSDLWQLLYKVRESAELAYARELDLVELDRRILFLLHNVGPLVPADISGAVGVDKAQVSRSVKRLLEIKMVDRDQLRAPISLTSKGRLHADRLLRLAEMRNRELTFDVGDTELADFFAVIEKLLDQAVLLFEQERQLSQAAADLRQYPRPGAAVESDGKAGDKIVLDRSRIISPLMTLSSYFSRSGSLTFKRLTGLSNFEAWVLNEIGMEPPIDWNVLVERLDRDHSQAGRTVRSLLERGLIEREGGPGRRHGRFAPTDEGQRLFEVIQNASRQRSTFLLAPLSQAERDRFLATFDKIRRNAVVQLEREKTYEELGRR